MLEIDQSDQAALQNFLARRHPDYDRLLSHWEFCERTYEGGREWFNGNIFRYLKEGDTEYNDRVARAYRFNHTREVVDLIQKYIFKTPVARNLEDAPPCVVSFWEDATLAGLNIDQFARLSSVGSSKFGRVWIFVDNTKTGDIQTKADEKAAGAKCYAYIVGPKDVLDIGFSDTGDLNWILVRERVRDDKDPINATGEVSERYRLWTKDSWYLFTICDKEDAVGSQPGVTIAPGAQGIQQLNLPGVLPYIVQATVAGQRVFIELVDKGEYKIGRVPCFPLDNVIGDHKYTSPALIADVAYLDRAVANYASNLDAIIQDQTFSQLAMPAQNLLPGDDKYESVREAGTKRIFLYDGDGGSKPEYLSPDVKQADVIVTVIKDTIHEIYHSLGMGGERTKSDNTVGTDNSSGVAKAYDFERLNSLLTTKSEALENLENKLVELVCLWNGEPIPVRTVDNPLLVKYADTFDVRSLYDEFTVAENLQVIQAPDSVRAEQMKQVITKLFPVVAKNVRAKMIADLKNWPPAAPEIQLAEANGVIQTQIAAAQPAPAGNTPTGAKSKPNKNPQTANRQGQVTSATGK